MDAPARVQIATFVLLGALVAVGILLVLSFFAQRDKDRAPQASLGCGTLILIAIIVSI